MGPAVGGAYFHDGEAAKLTQAVHIMERLQLDRKVDKAEFDQIAVKEPLTVMLSSSVEKPSFNQ